MKRVTQSQRVALRESVMSYQEFDAWRAQLLTLLEEHFALLELEQAVKASNFSKCGCRDSRCAHCRLDRAVAMLGGAP